VAVAGFIALSPAALAQAVDSGALLRQQQQNAPGERSVPKPPADAPKLEVRKPAAETAPAPSGRKVFVKRFKLSAPSALLSESELNSLLGAFLGRDNALEELQKAAEQVASHLRARGYVFARAFLPQQELADGAVVMEIVNGRLSRETDGRPSITLKTDGKSRLDPERAKAMMAAAVSDPAGLNIREIERGLLLLNDLPGIRGTGVVVPGREPGTAGLAVDVSEGSVAAGWLGYDNFGSRSTGIHRGTAGAYLNDPTGRGDLAEFNAAKSSGTESVGGSYLAPIGVSGLRARVAASGMRYRVVEPSSLDATGGSTWLSAGLSYPIVRTQAGSLYLTGTMDGKRFKDSVAGVQTGLRRTRALSAGIQGNRQFSALGRALTYSAALARGQLDRSAVPSDLAADGATRRTQGSYSVLRASAAWWEPLGPNFSFSASLSAQLSGKNLDSSEKIYLGGPRGVRAYPIEEAGGDEGQILNLEARWRAVQARERGGWDCTLFGFFDAGRVVVNKTTWPGWNTGNADLPNQYALKGLGLGLRFEVAQIAKIDLVAARKVGDNPGKSATGLDANGRSDKGRIWLVGTILF
jgi:hemolysin activation/secretion protein